MKLEIELEDIMANGDISESVKAGVIEKLSEGLEDKISSEIGQVITKEITDKIKFVLGAMIPSLLDYQFVETTSWGENKKMWTVRNRILAAIESECKLNGSRYSSDKNLFTEVFYKAVEKHLYDVASDIRKKLDASFTEECISIATERLRDRLKITVSK